MRVDVAPLKHSKLSFQMAVGEFYHVCKFSMCYFSKYNKSLKQKKVNSSDSEMLNQKGN